jgi:hypothetical protein
MYMLNFISAKNRVRKSQIRKLPKRLGPEIVNRQIATFAEGPPPLKKCIVCQQICALRNLFADCPPLIKR